jgi:hypothetical protein
MQSRRSVTARRIQAPPTGVSRHRGASAGARRTLRGSSEWPEPMIGRLLPRGR